MYLSLLNEEQKELFLHLAVYLASADNDLSEQEIQLIQSYSKEFKMNIDPEIFNTNIDIDRIINRFYAISDIREMKIIVFELIGLAMADHKYDDSERIVIKKLISSFDLEINFDVFCENKLSQYFILQEELNTAIL